MPEKEYMQSDDISGKETDDLERAARRRRDRWARQRARRERTVRRQKIMVFLGCLLAVLLVAAGAQVIRRMWAKSRLSEAVLGYRDTVERYAEEAGITQYEDVLLAIMMVESEGKGNDVMQSSESKGLEPNSLTPEESIEQACAYFAALIEIAGEYGVQDDEALIQAYNFGPAYLEYIAAHGGRHSEEIAIEYARQMSGGEKVPYLDLYAVKVNGGWIYKFGNMFYCSIVMKYL